MHKHIFEAVDRTFRDIMAQTHVPFGGKVVVLGGDFRQILHVIPRGSRADVVAGALNHWSSIIWSSIIWPHVQKCPLHTNMRVFRLLAAGGAAAADAPLQQARADFLRRVGDGTEPTFPAVGEGCIRVPAGTTVEALMQEVYGGMPADATARSEFLIQRAILTPLNDDVDAINTAADRNFERERERLRRRRTARRGLRRG
jgi:ATP-dependent DNA helicase PIF1